MVQRARKFLVVLVTVVIMTSTPVSIVGVAGGTQVSDDDSASGGSVYPGQTVPVANFSVQSEDEKAYSNGINLGSEIKPFGPIDQYSYINDGTDKSQYQKEDDVLRVVSGNTTEDMNQMEVRKFNSSIIYIDDITSDESFTENRYDVSDDIYSLNAISGTPPIFDSGTHYSTFKSSEKYLAPATYNGGFDTHFPIIASSNHVLEPNDEIIEGGSSDILKSIPSKVKFHNDQKGSSYYDPLDGGNFGEPIYYSGDDNIVSPGKDTRATRVRVYSGHDDGNITTINLNLDNKIKIRDGDADINKKLSDFSNTPTINEIDPDGSENSPIGVFGSEDHIIIDTDRDGYYDKKDDIVLQGNPTDGDAYTKSNIQGEWRNGSDEMAEPLIVFDKGYNNGENDDDLIIQFGNLEIDSAYKYSDAQTPLKYWDNDDSAKFDALSESAYFDVDGDSQSNEISSEDFRLSNFVTTYQSQTEVKTEDVDSGVSLSGFSSSRKFLDDNNNGELDSNELIIESTDKSISTTDNIVISGIIDRSSNQFSKDGKRIDLHYGTGEYLENYQIISIGAEFNKSSGGYGTNSLSYGETVELNSFEEDDHELERYISTKGEFRDGDKIVRLERFVETSNNQIDFQAHDVLTANKFSPNVKYANGSGTYEDGKGIIQEHDSSDNYTTYGDRLTAITVENDGSLPSSAIESVSIEREGEEIATTSSQYNGVWTLRPAPENATINTSETNLTVTATVSASAPTDATLDFQVSPLDDGGIAGEFDTGDHGLFFADAQPRGGLDTGPTYSVADPADISAEAVAFRNPESGYDPAIEVAFTDDIDPATTEPADFEVETIDSSGGNVTGIGDDDGDGRVLLELENDVAPAEIKGLAIGDGVLSVTSGAAVPGQSIPLTTTSVTVAEASERSRIVYRGERVAVLANDAGASGEVTPNFDERIRIDRDTTGDGDVDELVSLERTGPASLVSVLETNGSNASAFRATFESDDGDSGETVSMPVEPVALSVRANRTNRTDAAGPIGATITAADGDRVIRAELREVGNETVLAERTLRLDRDGEGVVRFPARVANVTIVATDLGTGVSNRSANVTVRKGYPGVQIVREVIEEERGGIVRIGLRVVDTKTANVTIGGPEVNYQERVTVADRDDDGKIVVEWNSHRAGSGGPGKGIGVAGSDNASRPDDRIQEVERSAPKTPFAAPLERGNYTLEASVDGEVTDVALLSLDALSTDGASTLVAPSDATLDTPAAVENVTTARETVAVGDTAIVAIEAGGLDGFLNESTDLRRGSPAAARTGAYLDLRQANPPKNARAPRLNVSSASTVLDGQDGELYVVVPTDGDPYSLEAGTEFDARFVVNESSPYVGPGTSNGNDEPESVETGFDLETPDGQFAELSENGTLDLAASNATSIAGETNVAPGTTVTVTMRSDDENETFQESDEDTVDEDGSFEGSVDLSDYDEGTEYTVVATANDEELTGVRTGSIVEEPVSVQAAQTVTTAAAGGGTGGGGGGSGGDEMTEPAETTTETSTTARPTTVDSPDPETTTPPIPQRAATFVTRDLPEFVRTRETTIVVGLGILAFLYGLVGLRRLTQ